MSRSVSSVEGLWREYDIGLVGQPSVRDTYEVRAHAFRNDDAERKFFARRKIIIEQVKNLAQTLCLDPVAIALRFDAYRCEQRPVMSLSALEIRIKRGELPPGLSSAMRP